MSLPRSLPVLLVAICAAHLCAAQWPCPDSAAIDPCVCTATTDYEVYMDCSDITDDAELASKFDTPFPFNDIKKLTINPSTPSPTFTILPNYVFDEKTFEEIEITNTLIETVEEETFVNSHGTAKLLNLQSNEISSFPFETLENFMLLDKFNISYNKLTGVSPDIVSSLHTLDLSGNTGFKLTETTFFYSQSLTELRLNEMGLDNTTPANMFRDLLQLETLYLNNNDLSGELIQDFINTELKPLKRVELIGNSLSSIHELAVTGLNAEEGTIFFSGNEIRYLWQEDWEPLASSVTQANAIDITSNPLVCGCDVMWLLSDSELMAKFEKTTTCSNETQLVDLQLDWLEDYCQCAPGRLPKHLSSLLYTNVDSP